MRKISLRQSIYIAKRISFLLDAGMALPDAFGLIAGQMKKNGDVLKKISSNISQGHSITETISGSNIFGASAVPMIKIGEESGTLAESFSALSDELEKSAQLKQKIIGAILYPACISTGMLVLVIVLMTVVFPKMVGVFESLNVTLPISTRILIWVSGAVQRFGLLMAIGVVALIVMGLVYYRRSVKFHTTIDKFLLKIPLLSIMVRVYMLASISNVVGLLLTNHSSLIVALQVASQTSINYAYRNVLSVVAKEVAAGVPLGKTLAQFENYFPKEYCDLVTIGERTGKLSETFTYAHTLYAHDLDALTKSLSSSIEPVMMVCIGLLIGIIALSVVSPMYSITSHLHGT